ncbi:hypothetical protein LXA43DRAFT_1068440 [Ganoderma leucocontextum]|nr:hypothetical protein LXA43DRAFT_1068440 [Ganoderma leucocontextum]
MLSDLDTVLEDILYVQSTTSQSLADVAGTNATDDSGNPVSTALHQATVERELSEGNHLDIVQALTAQPHSSEDVVCGTRHGLPARCPAADVCVSSSPARVFAVTANHVQFAWHDTLDEELDYTHIVECLLIMTDIPVWTELGLREEDLIICTALRKLLSIFTQWRAGQLRELAHAHEMRVFSRDSALTLLERINTHTCGRLCPAVIAVFRPLQRRRTQAQVERNTLRRVEAISLASPSYTEVASEELRRSIIREWQEIISTDNLQTSVCGPCGRRTPSSLVTMVPPSEFDLSLLRNDGLPSAVKPTTYNFDAYQEALLNPKGLVNRWELGDVRMCEACRRELVGKHRMPRLSLANCLYYGHDELPPDVKQYRTASVGSR